ncbi:MAG: twitching motility protein PilJ [Nitrococcus mobilis]|nr:twitching motility protein PilJ [Nitrococcus mobilis]
MKASLQPQQAAGLRRTAHILTALVILATLLMTASLGYVVYYEKFARESISRVEAIRVQVQRIAQNTAAAVDGNVNAFERLQQVRDEFQVNVEALAAANSANDRPASSRAAQALHDLVQPWQKMRGEIDTILKHRDQVLAAASGRQAEDTLAPAAGLAQVQQAAQAIAVGSAKLLARADTLAGVYRNLEDARPVKGWHGVVFGVLALILLTLRGVVSWRLAQRELQAAEEARARADEQSNKTQAAIRVLLDEIEGLREGDLTVQASVGEAFTGAIGDAFNDAIEELRGLVATINEISGKISSAAQQTQATAMHLAEASDHQAHQITGASAAVSEMAVSIDQVSRNAEESSQVAQQAVEIALKGAATVKRTIAQMDNIREQIQETSKRIKRLGESSQEIGNIVELINDIADQTNILALNASIQAAMAGESGRGFAVVADEVQRLAERSGNATKQIEGLVKTIQADTNEAAISMEQSTTGVVAGARQAEEAGEALHEIENVSQHLAGLIRSISEASRQQANAAGNISDSMNVIQEITSQTSAGTNETASSIGNLADLAAELRGSVAGFKLPGPREAQN